MAGKAGKKSPSQGLMTASEGFRNKQENAEILEKAVNNFERMEDVLWRSTLRSYFDKVKKPKGPK